MYLRRCDSTGCKSIEARREFLYGASSVPAGGNHGDAAGIPVGAEEDADGPPFCGQGAEYGSDRGEQRREAADDSGAPIDYLQGTRSIYAGNIRNIWILVQNWTKTAATRPTPRASCGGEADTTYSADEGVGRVAAELE